MSWGVFKGKLARPCRIPFNLFHYTSQIVQQPNIGMTLPALPTSVLQETRDFVKDFRSKVEKQVCTKSTFPSQSSFQHNSLFSEVPNVWYAVWGGVEEPILIWIGPTCIFCPCFVHATFVSLFPLSQDVRSSALHHNYNP